MTILVTGAAGFIGYHTVRVLLAGGEVVVGVDNLNDYYDVALKEARLSELARSKHAERFTFRKTEIADRAAMETLFGEVQPQTVIHLAAQPGVRYAAENPHAYAQSNLIGFLNILEGCRHNGVGHLVFASSSSVYGASADLPYREDQHTDHPVSLYGATKKSNEMMAHAYAHLYGVPTSGLRFFTVYGPWGRPDMSPMIFTRRILAGEAIDVFNEGRHSRDFTYVDDIVDGIARIARKPATSNAEWDAKSPDPASSLAPYRLYNIGNTSRIGLLDFITALEAALGVKAKLNMLPMQPGDVAHTFADVSALTEATGFAPATPLADGLASFVAWYRAFYG